RDMSADRSTRTATILLWGAFVVGVILRAAVLLQTTSLGTGIVDEQHYRWIATNIYEHGEFAAAAGNPTSIRPPLYPGLISAIWFFTSPQNLQAVRAVQIALSLATAIVVFFIGRRLFGYRTACYAAAFTWLYPSLIFFDFLILTETLFTFLLLSFVLLLVMLI